MGLRISLVKNKKYEINRVGAEFISALIGWGGDKLHPYV